MAAGWTVERVAGTLDGSNLDFTLSAEPVYGLEWGYYPFTPLEKVTGAPQEMQYSRSGVNVHFGLPPPSAGRRPWFAYYHLLLAFTLLFLLTSQSFAAQVIDERLIPNTIPRNSQLAPTGQANGICIGNAPGPTPAITFCSNIDMTGSTVFIKLPEVTIANLPANHALSIITNGSAGDDCVKGGGSTRVLCAWNGAAWASIGGGTGTGTGDLTEVQGTGSEICVTNGTGPIPIIQLCSTIVTDGKTLRVGRFEITNDIRPTTITGNTDDWTPSNVSSAGTIAFATNGVWEIRGLNAGSDGRVLTLYNVGSFAAVFTDETNTSTAANRFGFGSNITLGPKQGMLIQYDSTASRWRNLSGPGRPPKYCADAGASDAYACNLPEVITVYTVGEHYFFKANTANTGAATLAFNGISSPAAPTIKKVVGGITTDLETNDIRVGQIVEVAWDGTNWQMMSQLGNSPTGISGLTTGCVTKAFDASHVADSSLCEDADSLNASKSLEVGDISTNSVKIVGTGITGKVVMLAQTLRKRVIHFVIGSDAGADLTDSDDQPDVFENQLAAFHITSVKCRTDTGTSTINLHRNGSTPDILSSNLVCSTAGATSTSFTSGEDAIAVGQMIDFKMVTAATTGTPKRVAVTISALVDSE